MEETMGKDMSEGTGDLEVRDLLDGLIQALQDHARLHRRLQAVLERKRAPAADGKAEDLEAIAEEERELFESIASSERRRLDLTEKVGAAYRFPSPRRVRLLDLIQLVGEEHRESMLELRDEVRDIADELDRLNGLHRTLAIHSLESARLILFMLRGTESQATGPSPGEWKDDQNDSILLDRRT